MFRGSIVALATPFKPNFDIDFDAYARLIEFQIDQGTDGIVPCGCTGEAATLAHTEQEQIIKYCIEKVAGRVPVIAGTGSNNTKEALSLTKFAKDAGADGALLITPYYNKPTPAGQIAHYKLIAEETGIPIMLYNVPRRTSCRKLSRRWRRSQTSSPSKMRRAAWTRCRPSRAFAISRCCPATIR
jgi:4-hydroxy-tetrahydrodipicolinate synthase